MTDEVDFDVEEDRNWKCCAEQVPSSEIVFAAQVIVVYLVIAACIINLTLGNEPHDLWVALLSSSLGYILPAPALSKT